MIEYLTQESKQKIIDEIVAYWDIKKVKRIIAKHNLMGGKDYTWEDKPIDIMPNPILVSKTPLKGNNTFTWLNFLGAPTVIDLLKEANKKLEKKYYKEDKAFVLRYMTILIAEDSRLSSFPIKIALKVIKRSVYQTYESEDE